MTRADYRPCATCGNAAVAGTAHCPSHLTYEERQALAMIGQPGDPGPGRPAGGGVGAGKVIAVLVALGVIIALVAIGASRSHHDAPDNPYTYAGPPVDVGGGEVPTSHEIIYYLTGSARSADLTLQLGPGGESQQQDVGVPLMNRNGDPGLSFDASNGDFLYISAQNNGSGTLHCRITEDGVVVAEQRSSGEFAIVTCSGSA